MGTDARKFEMFAGFVTPTKLRFFTNMDDREIVNSDVTFDTDRRSMEVNTRMGNAMGGHGESWLNIDNGCFSPVMHKIFLLEPLLVS